MKLGLVLGYWGAKPIDRFIALAQRAEALGFDIVCTSEAYGSDALTPLAAIATHTTRIKLGTAIRSFDGRAAFTSWLYRVVLNAVRDMQRAGKRRGRYADAYAEVTPEDQPAEQEEAATIAALGIIARAALIAPCTSVAALLISRLKSNCKVIRV